MFGALRKLLVAACVGLTMYAIAGGFVAGAIRAASLRDDPEHELDLHALLSIVMCWPHDVQGVGRPARRGGNAE
ncbi:MAG: hypothetical protein ACYDAG_18115 [Chloroflexota bacterium]